MSAPFLDDKALPTTPATEWANDTKAALHSDDTIPSSTDNTSPRPNMQPAVSTPGPNMPGAFGGGPDPVVDESGPSEAPGGILETAKQYIPASVASYFPGAPKPEPSVSSKEATSLPSQETEGNIHSHVGVGSLPGHASETSVARLPDERAVEPETAFLTPATNPSTAHENRQSSASEISTQAQTGSDVQTPGQLTPIRAVTPELEGSSTIPGLPGGVASTTSIESELTPPPTPMKPVERLADETVPHREATGLPSQNSTTDNASSASFERLNGRKETNLVSESPEKSSVLSTPTLNPDGRMYHMSTAARDESTSSLPSDNKIAPNLPQVDSSTADAGHSSSKFHEPDSPTINSSRKSTELASHKSIGSEGSGTSASSGRKPKFMDKLKGEVKVLSGKMSHNEEKIEEGKKLMGKV